MLCKFCQKEISPERLEALPNVNSCIDCAEQNTSIKKAYMVYGHKTAPEIMFINSSDKEAIRQADRANRRSR